MKKITGFIASSVLAVSMLTASAGAEAPDRLLVLGDSITTGYGLDGYVQGDNTSASASFSNMLAAGLELDSHTYVNLAVDGQTSAELLDGLDTDEAANSDCIIISIGGNDYLIPLIEAIAAAVENNTSLIEQLGITPDTSSTEKSLSTLGLAVLLDQSGEILSKIASDVASDDNVEALTEIVGTTVKNVGEIAQKIYEVNPDAEIFLLNIYNPFDGAAVFGEISTLADTILSGIRNGYDDIAAEYTTNGYELNIINSSAAFDGNASLYTNILQLDIHPNAAGHRLILELICEGMGIAVPEEAENTATETVDASSDASVEKTDGADAKGNADTGIESVAAFIGIGFAALASAVVSRRRK